MTASLGNAGRPRLALLGNTPLLGITKRPGLALLGNAVRPNTAALRIVMETRSAREDPSALVAPSHSDGS